ncbi:hypothetical protein [Allorhodopirellula solitaria]|uniref:hypothetical protein n=1 Tax=Allorhodopirellula solitaria TaxID=2527987 RepID=UPI0016441965|nr:hypothetical protein [Allorhodopirellula solitaria]
MGPISMHAVAMLVLAGLVGCQPGRLMTPLARHRAMDNSPPSIHGPSMAGPASGKTVGADAAQSSGSQVQVTSETAVPETDLEPVDQRLAKTRQIARRSSSANTVATRRTLSELAAEPASSPAAAPLAQTVTPIASHPPHRAASQNVAATEIAQVSANMPIEPERAPAFELPENYSGVDISDLVDALQGAPPEIQKAALTKLIASSHRRARKTSQPAAIDDALAASFGQLPELPRVVPDRDVSPSRIGLSRPPTPRWNVAESAGPPAEGSVANAVAQASSPTGPTIQRASLETTGEPKLNAVADLPTSELAPASELAPSSELAVVAPTPDPIPPPPSTPQSMSLSDQVEPSESVSLSFSDTPAEKNVSAEVSLTDRVADANRAPASATAATLSDADLFDALVARLGKEVPGESDSERHRREVVARHLMVLSGDPDRAVDDLDDLSEEQTQYLRHQLLGLWKIVDPQGHPVPSHRFSSALPEIRKATGYLAVASNSLEVRALEFCTEIEAYGQIKPFPNRRFDAGQEVILYCEIDNFVSHSVEGGFETRLRGSYDLLNANGERIASQALPEDHQISRNHLRDYFIAYQMYLPDAIEPGRYQLRLTMEDIHGKKYGQATVDFEIKR